MYRLARQRSIPSGNGRTTGQHDKEYTWKGNDRRGERVENME